MALAEATLEDKGVEARARGTPVVGLGAMGHWGNRYPDTDHSAALSMRVDRARPMVDAELGEAVARMVKQPQGQAGLDVKQGAGVPGTMPFTLPGAGAPTVTRCIQAPEKGPPTCWGPSTEPQVLVRW